MSDDASGNGDAEEWRQRLARTQAQATERVENHRRTAWDALQRAAQSEFRLKRQVRLGAAERHRLNWQLRQLRDVALGSAMKLVRVNRAEMFGTLKAASEESGAWVQASARRFEQQLDGLARAMATEPAPPHAALLADLLIAADHDFVASAYLVILGRSADADGLAHYAGRLAAGDSRLDILRSLRTAPEGRAAMVQDIDELLALDSRRRWPLLGALWYEPRYQRRHRQLVALALTRLAHKARLLANTPPDSLFALASPRFRQWQATLATVPEAAEAGGAPRDTTDKRMARALARELDAALSPIQPSDQPTTAYYWIDHTAQLSFNSGIQRVVRGMARALMANGVRLIPVKWDEAKQRFYPPSSDELEHMERWNGPAADAWAPWLEPSFANGADWLLVAELTTYLQETDLHDVKRAASRAGLRVAGLLFDAIPWKMPLHYSEPARLNHARYMMQLATFDLVMTISQLVRDDLLGFLAGSWTDERLGHAQVVAVELPGEMSGLPQVTRPKEPPAPEEPIRILSVGSIEPRKNQLKLLEAFEIARARSHRPLELVIAGGDSYHPALAERVRERVDQSPAIRWELSPSDQRLQELYLEADFTVYPSLEEGFGLPILESLWYARPCICRDRSAMAEVAVGGGCVLVDTADGDQLADAILRLARDPELRRKLALEGIAREFKSWTAYGAEIAAVLTQQSAPAAAHREAQSALPEAPRAARLLQQVAAWQPATPA